MVTGVETFGKAMERAVAGDNAALLLRGVRRHQVRRTAAPGDQITVTVELGQPVALAPGLGFALREGGRTVGAGTVGTLLD